MNLGQSPGKRSTALRGFPLLGRGKYFECPAFHQAKKAPVETSIPYRLQRRDLGLQISNLIMLAGQRRQGRLQHPRFAGSKFPTVRGVGTNKLIANRSEIKEGNRDFFTTDHEHASVSEDIKPFGATFLGIVAPTLE